VAEVAEAVTNQLTKDVNQRIALITAALAAAIASAHAGTKELPNCDADNVEATLRRVSTARIDEVLQITDVRSKDPTEVRLCRAESAELGDKGRPISMGTNGALIRPDRLLISDIAECKFLKTVAIYRIGVHRLKFECKSQYETWPYEIFISPFGRNQISIEEIKKKTDK
jgi:hypothetical protein